MLRLLVKNSDDTYHVTLQIENYNKIDVLQFSKPGVISDETEPRNALFGTYNLPESYIFEKDTAEDVRTAIDRYISEEWNENISRMWMYRQQIQEFHGIHLMLIVGKINLCKEFSQLWI